VGGVAGLGLLGLGLVDSFIPWLLCYFCGLFVFAYLYFGDSRSGYLGLQAAFALSLALVQTNGPATSLEPPVTRLVAIAVAVTLVALITSLVGPVDPRRILHSRLQSCAGMALGFLRALRDQLVGGDANAAAAGAGMVRAAAATRASLGAASRAQSLSPAQAHDMERRATAFALAAEAAVGLARDLPDNPLEASGLVAMRLPAALEAMQRGLERPDAQSEPHPFDQARKLLDEDLAAIRSAAIARTEPAPPGRKALVAAYIEIRALADWLARAGGETSEAAPPGDSPEPTP